ncbi:TPA: hypothetical protein DEP21_04305 [Patescibacteria group bacterium]|nr:hypothetical protein [Candidatus Gracilibacteria bacterium]
MAIAFSSLSLAFSTCSVSFFNPASWSLASWVAFDHFFPADSEASPISSNFHCKDKTSQPRMFVASQTPKTLSFTNSKAQTASSFMSANMDLISPSLVWSFCLMFSISVIYLSILALPISTLKVFFRKSATAFQDFNIPLIAQKITSTQKFHALAIAPGTACQIFPMNSKIGFNFSLRTSQFL